MIPEKDKAESFEEFRPIALCNTLYKLLTKTIANRLHNLLPLLISEEQTNFVPECSIYDGIIIAQEGIHIVQTNKDPSMLMKLDIKKAYDKVDWHFLFTCLEAFGFARQWINLIYEYISTPRMSILVNGSPAGFFNSSRGLRQGDPISPFLFILMAESLGRLLNIAREKSSIQEIKITSGDTILFGHNDVEEAKAIKQILHTYWLVSGQEINTTKSNIFFFNTEEKLVDKICKTFKFNKGIMLCKYLGIPLDKGCRSSNLWDQIISKIKNRISSWSGKWLSSAGKATMIN